MLSLSDASCNNGNGCSDQCSVEFIDNKVYGCDGVWYKDGLDNAEFLCKNGYHICQSYTEAEDLGLTKDQCTSTALIPPNYFYITRQSSTAKLICDNTGTNDLFGCASSTDTGWLYFGDGTTPITCGPFGATLSTLSAEYHQGWRYGWEPWGGEDDHENELTYIKHRYNKRRIGTTEHWEYTNGTFGGVLCCLDTSIQTTLYTTTESILECDACSDEATCDVEFVSDAIYGCGGTWNETGMENAEYLCGDGYEICHDGDIAAEMGLTEDICKNKPKANHFYASSAHSYPDTDDVNDNDKCTNYNLENISKPLGYDDVFGCGDSNEGWIQTTYVNCGSFSSKIEWGPLDEAKYGWMLRDIDQQNELKAIRHTYKRGTNETFGGALCCKKVNATAQWDPWHIEKTDKHKCKVSTGCTRKTGLITCDVEFIPNRVYGCGGEFTNRGIQNGDWICRNGYSICSTDTLVEEYGLTKEMCASYPKNNHFYASYSSTDNGITCHDNLAAETHVFGCGLDVSSNWLWTISEWTENNIPVSCGPYTAALTEFNIKNGQKYGWNVSAGGHGKEKYYTKHLLWDYGGVMCCRNIGESTYEAEYHKNLLSFWSARVSEFISLFVTVIIIILSWQGINQKKRTSGSRSPRGRSKKCKCDVQKVELVPIFAYLVYFIGVIELLWSVISIWLMTNNYNAVEENMNCEIILQVRNAFHILYKIGLYLFLIYKIEGVLHGSAYAYHSLVYLSLKIFSIGGVIITYSLLFISSFVEYQQFPGVIGWDCYLSVDSWLLFLQGTVDGIASIICCFMFIYKLYFVLKQSGADATNPSRFRSIIFRNTLLSFIALSSTWIFYYVGFQAGNFLEWFYSLDFLINNLCIWLMFKHNQLVFRKLCCVCFIYCGCQCAEKNTQIFGSRNSKETSKFSKTSKTTKGNTRKKDDDTWHTPIHQEVQSNDIELKSLDISGVVTPQESVDIDVLTHTESENIEKNMYEVTNK